MFLVHYYDLLQETLGEDGQGVNDHLLLAPSLL